MLAEKSYEAGRGYGFIRCMYSIPDLRGGREDEGRLLDTKNCVGFQ